MHYPVSVNPGKPSYAGLNKDGYEEEEQAMHRNRESRKPALAIGATPCDDRHRGPRPCGAKDDSPAAANSPRAKAQIEACRRPKPTSARSQPRG
jgi:hypothetical protein